MASEIQVQTISGPPTGANANKVIIPAGQTLSVADGIQPVDLPAGSTLQMETSQTISSGWISTTSTSFVDSGIAVSLTALKTGSKFRVSFVANMSHATNDNIRVNVWRNDVGLRGVNYSFGYQNGGQNYYQPTVIDYLDNSVTTAGTAYEYKIYFMSEGGNQVHLVHNSSGYYLTVEEIAQ